MATEIRYANNVQRHDNHTPPGSLTKRTFPQPINSLILSNISTSGNVSISFDGIQTITVKPGGVFSMDFAQLYSYWTSGNGTDGVEVVTGSER